MTDEAEAPAMPDIPVAETSEQSIAAIREGRTSPADQRVADEYGLGDVLEEPAAEVADDTVEVDAEPADDDDPKADDGTDDDADGHDDESTPAESKALVDAREAFEAGDLEKALKLAFGDKVTADTFKINPKQYSALRRKARADEGKAKEREAGLEQKEAAGLAAVQKEEARIEQMRQKAVAILTPANELNNALTRYKTHGDTDSVVAQFEKTTGVDFNDFLQKHIHNDKTPPVPKAVTGEMAELKAQLAAMQAKLDAKPEPSALEKKAAQEAQVASFNEYLDEQLEGNQVTKLPGWQKKVLVEMRSAYDKELGKTTMSPQFAAKRIVARARKAAEALGHVVPTKGKAPKKARSTTTTNRLAPETGSETDAGPYQEDGAMKEILKMRALRRSKAGR